MMEGWQEGKTRIQEAEERRKSTPTVHHENTKGEKVKGNPIVFFVPSNFRAFVIRFAFELADS